MESHYVFIHSDTHLRIREPFCIPVILCMHYKSAQSNTPMRFNAPLTPFTNLVSNFNPCMDK